MTIPTNLITKALKISSEKMYRTYVDTRLKKAIVFDLDGTLCEIGESSNPYNHDGEELPTWLYEREVTKYPDSYAVIILTGRKRREYGELTENWLHQYHILFDRLIMQEWGQAKKNHIYKEEALKELMQEYEIVMLYDDNPDVWEVCERLWIPFQLVEKSNILVDCAKL